MQVIIEAINSPEKLKVMTKFVKISLKIIIFSAIFVVASIAAVVITSLITQSDIHPDYWKLGAAEKTILSLLIAAYGLVVFNSFRRSKRVEKQQFKSASPVSNSCSPTRLRRAGEQGVRKIK
jgi:hypothetical protein